MIEARSRAGLTQEELAERMGTTQPVVARLESGRIRPSTHGGWRGRGSVLTLQHFRLHLRHGKTTETGTCRRSLPCHGQA